MIPILVSQRRDFLLDRNEVRDSLDISLYTLLAQLGFLPHPIPSITPLLASYIDAIDPRALILSGGNDLKEFPERDRAEISLLTYAASNTIPILGICRGMQIINYFQGGSQRLISSHSRSRHKLYGPISSLYPSPVNSYHNYGIMHSDLGAYLEPLAWTDDGVIEAFRHIHLPWLGIMWHPERENPFSTSDIQLVSAHFKSLNL